MPAAGRPGRQQGKDAFQRGGRGTSYQQFGVTSKLLQYITYLQQADLHTCSWMAGPSVRKRRFPSPSTIAGSFFELATLRQSSSIWQVQRSGAQGNIPQQSLITHELISPAEPARTLFGDRLTSNTVGQRVLGYESTRKPGECLRIQAR